jgi:hypothetical protein
MSPQEMGRPASATEAAPTLHEAPDLTKSLTPVVDGTADGGPTASPQHPSLNTLQALNQQLRDEGIARAAAALDSWTRSCWQVGIAYWASVGRPFGADEVRELGVPEPSSNGAVGAQFVAAANAGLIRPVGFVQSRRPSRHRSWQRQWIGSEAA